MTQMITQAEPTVVGKECRFAVYMPPPEHGMPDYHLVKENLHMSDGTVKPNTIMVKDFKRPFWHVKKGFQNHKQKKEWEKIERLIEGSSTQSKLVDSCAKALGKGYFNGNLRKLSSDPYLYGADILSTAVIKRTYQDKYKETPITPFSVAVFDTETDVVNGTKQVIMASLTMKNICFTVVVREFLKGIANPHERVEAAMNKYLGEYVKKRGIKPELVIVNTELDVIAACMNKAHELKPDFLAIWNIAFDIEKIIEACDRRQVNPADIFSDPSVPKEYRYFKYAKGPTQKVTASGLVTPIKPAAQWHTVYCPASFYIIDAMCAFKHIRIGQPEKQSYSLDFILNDQLGVRKLKFEEAKDFSGLKWHQFMQTTHKIEYIIYNRFDCISMEELDEKTLDLSASLPSMSGCSDFVNFKSQPRRAADNLHYYCLSKGRVIGTTSGEMADEMDDDTVGLDGWIN